MADKRKNIKGILCVVAIVSAVIAIFTVAFLYADGHFDGTVMKQIVPALMWSLFVGLEAMRIFNDLFDSSVPMWIAGGLSTVAAFLLGFFNMSSVVIIIAAILGVALVIMGIMEK